MIKRAALLILYFSLMLFCSAAAAQDQQFAALGDFRLENGDVIRPSSPARDSSKLPSLASARDALSASSENHLDGRKIDVHGYCRHAVFAGDAVSRFAGAINSLESFIIAVALDRVDRALCATRHAVLARGNVSALLRLRRENVAGC
jgi:hypothetical protein